MAVKVKKNYVIVNRDGRYVRKDPNTYGEVIMKVTKGDKFEYLNELSNGWFKVKIKGTRKVGWIHNTSGSIREG